MPAKAKLAPIEEPDESRRTRKKVRTKLAIEDAAFELFASQGYEATTVEQIAARADIAYATFFRYFPGKTDVVLGEHSSTLPALAKAIIERPPEEDDLTAFRHALNQVWVAHADGRRIARVMAAVQDSALLQGISYKIGRKWLIAASEGFARRHKLRKPTEEIILSANLALAVMGNALDHWAASHRREDLRAVIDRNFALAVDQSATWRKPRKPRAAKRA